MSFEPYDVLWGMHGHGDEDAEPWDPFDGEVEEWSPDRELEEVESR